MGSWRKVLREKLAADQKSLDLLHPIPMLHESDFMKSLSQETPARLDLDGTVKHFLQRLGSLCSRHFGSSSHRRATTGDFFVCAAGSLACTGSRRKAQGLAISFPPDDASEVVPKLRLTRTIAISPFERKKNGDRANVWRTRRPIPSTCAQSVVALPSTMHDPDFRTWWPPSMDCVASDRPIHSGRHASGSNY
jgi:hypothetical protein